MVPSTPGVDGRADINHAHSSRRRWTTTGAKHGLRSIFRRLPTWRVPPAAMAAWTLVGLPAAELRPAARVRGAG